MSNYTCFRKTVTVHRPTGEYVDGHWVAGNESIINFKASVQPMSPKDMQELPEGRRADETFKLYTSFKLQTVTDLQPDYLLIDNIAYEVVSVGSYQSNVINHYKVMIAKKAIKR